MNQIGESDFSSLLLGKTHWIDVRSPIEFQAGAVPHAINLPLLADDERHAVGIQYKNAGKDAAISLGHQLVNGTVRAEREQKWMDEIKGHPNSVIYCFRGGLRSQTVQSWLKEKNVDCPLIQGGYKALRRYFLEILEEKINALEFLIVSGPTGSGKTKYLSLSKKPFLDLEALAKHRGSAFGATSEPQPGQIDFENSIALVLLKHLQGNQPILVEDESRMIGKCSLPEALFNKIKSSPKIILDVPFEQRVENIFTDYISHSSLGKNHNPQRFDDFRRAIYAISKKLGGLRTQEVLNDLDSCKQEFQSTKNLDSNRIWIRKLLNWYYDPVYNRYK